MYISGQNNIYRNPVNKNFFDIKRLEKAEKEEKESRAETTEKMYSDLREDDLEISPEGRLAAVLEQEAREQADSGIEAREKQSASKEQEETEIAEKQDDPEVSEEQGGKAAGRAAALRAAHRKTGFGDIHGRGPQPEVDH